MKTIVSLFLFPIMVFAQPYGQHQNESFDIEFSMNMVMESIQNEETDYHQLVDSTIEFFITVEVYVWEMEIDHVIPKFNYDGATANFLPKYLNILSLTSWPLIKKEEQRPQERLNSLLALNDPMYPKEDTLFSRLHPVKYQKNRLGVTENIPEGFGPRIKF